MTMKEITTKEFEKAVKYVIANGLRGYFEGFAGIGKSSIVVRLANELGMEPIDIRLSTCTEGDLFMRLPDADKTKMIELVNQDFKRDKKCVYLLDEFRHASNGLRKQAYQIIWDKKIGNYKFPEGCAVIALSNPTDEVETEEIERPLMDRFDLKAKVVFDFKEWSEWAYANGVRPEVIGFLSMFGDRCLNRDVDNIPLTPRTWDRVSRHLDSEFYLSMLPNETGLMFKAYLSKVHKFKDITKYLDGHAEFPNELDEQYALVSSVIGKVGNAKDDKVVLAWFAGKMKGVKAEVKTFGSWGVFNKHKQLLGGGDTGKYWCGLPKEVKVKLADEWRKMGYLADDSV